ncbi:MAG: hypothetical protein QM791_20330 [Ferruginibacter sp.]
MKNLKMMLLFIAFSTAVVSCKKDEVPSTPSTPDSGSNPVAGRWIGKFGFETESPDTYYSFSLKSNGTMEELNSSNEKIGEGTWTLVGTVFTAKHHYTGGNGTSFTDVATYNAQTKTFSNGTWGYSNNTSNGGKWFMSKQ